MLRSFRSSGSGSTPGLRRCFAAFALSLIHVAPSLRADDHIELKTTTSVVLRRRLEAGTVPLKDRQAAIEALFGQVGCIATEQPVNKKSANIVCTLAGVTPATIIVGAHYDYIERGTGLVDNWTGTALLASVYEALKTKIRTHTFRFIAFAAAEQGQAGSEHYVKKMTREERDSTRAFVSLECLGLTPPKVWVSRSDRNLVNRLVETANAIHVSLKGINAEKLGDDDAYPFFSKKIPVISIHSMTSETLRIVHSRDDTIDAINMDDYAAAYRLVAFYLAYLDSQLN